MIAGHDNAVNQLRSAWETRRIHHARLLAGPRGVGKASFARQAATRVLADAAGPLSDLPGLDVSPDHRIARLIAAGSHPDLRVIERTENPKKPGTLFRNIRIDQIRELQDLFGLTPAMSQWRAVVIDSADDLEQEAANALLKMLEEPPPNCLFFVVVHAPGRLLPTIRSRCRRLDFQHLDDDAMTAILAVGWPDLKVEEHARLIPAAAGSAGRALAFAALDLAGLQDSAVQILRTGDPTNARRAAMALELGRKGAAERYAAFLELVPSLIAREARRLGGAERERALDAYASARELTALAPRVSLDPAATIFQLGGILAAIAAPPLP